MFNITSIASTNACVCRENTVGFVIHRPGGSLFLLNPFLKGVQKNNSAIKNHKLKLLNTM